MSVHSAGDGLSQRSWLKIVAPGFEPGDNEHPQGWQPALSGRQKSGDRWHLCRPLKRARNNGSPCVRRLKAGATILSQLRRLKIGQPRRLDMPCNPRLPVPIALHTLRNSIGRRGKLVRLLDCAPCASVGDPPYPSGARTVPQWGTDRTPVGYTPSPSGGHPVPQWGTHLPPVGYAPSPSGVRTVPQWVRTFPQWGNHL